MTFAYDIWVCPVSSHKAIWILKKGAVSFYLELEVDVWLELHLKIYCKSYIPFVCERNKSF